MGTYITMGGEEIFQFVQTLVDPIASFLLDVRLGYLKSIE